MDARERSPSVSPPGQGLTVKLGSVADIAKNHSTAWAKLASERPEVAPFMDPAWTGTFESVCAQEGLLAVTAWEGDRLVGLAPLWRDERARRPLAARTISAPTFDWLNRYEFLAENSRRDVLDQMWQFWFERAGCHIIHLELVPEDAPTLASALAVASELGWTAAIEPTCRSPWRTLPSIQEGWDNGLKSKFKANLRNREQRLAKVGDVRFEVARGPEHLARAMELFYQLEASGWKGQKQTSIRQRPQVRRFYDAVVAGAPEDFWMPILSVDDKPIAAQFIRVCGATVYLLKIGFDPEFSPYSPGQLITARVMDYSIAHGCKTFDFLGEEMTWKMDWNPKLRTLCRAIFFAPALAGRCAYWSRVGFRELLKKVPGLHAFVRRTRKHSATE